MAEGASPAKGEAQGESGARLPWLGPAVMVLILPVALWIGAWVVEARMNAVWRDMLEARYGPLTEAEWERARLESLCTEPEFRGEEACEPVLLAELSQLGSLLTGGGGLALLALVAWAGGAARRDHRKLLGLFRATLALTALGLVALMLIQSANLVLVLYLLEVVFLEGYHPFILAGIGLSGLVATLVVGAGALRVFQPVKVSELAIAVAPAAEPELWQVVREVAQQVGTEPPGTLLLGLEPNCYVTEVPVRYAGGQSRGRLLYLSLPLLAVLEREELRAVLAHEFAHFHGEDTAFSRRFYPLYRGAQEALGGALSSLGENPRAIAVLPAIPVLGYVVAAFAVAAAERSRQRELEADRTAARVASSLAMATALLKVHLLAPAWPYYLHQLQQSAEEWDTLRRQWDDLWERTDSPDPDKLGELALTLERAKLPRASEMLQEYAQRLASSQAAPSWLAVQAQPHPVDSHPPLAVRLDALGVPLNLGWAGVRASLWPAWTGTMTLGGQQVGVEMRGFSGPIDPASALVTEAEAHEQALTALVAFALRLPALIKRVREEHSQGRPGPGRAA